MAPQTTVPVPVGEVSPETQLLLEGMLDILYEPGYTDPDRLSRVIGTDGIKEAFDRIREHPMGADVELIRVRIASAGIDPETGIAGINAVFSSSDPSRYQGELNVYLEAGLVDGVWKLYRASYCSSFSIIANAVGAGPFSCDDEVPPPTTSTTTTIVPETTTTIAPETTTIP